MALQDSNRSFTPWLCLEYSIKIGVFALRVDYQQLWKRNQ
jgi:hypothetical protein